MDSVALNYRQPHTWIVMVAFVAVVVVVGAIIGISTGPGAWYAALTKPPFNPPNWIFAPVWFTLYVLIGIAGARTYLRDAGSPQMVLWVLQMLLNWVWTPAWFTLHLLWPAFVVIAAILLLIIGFIVLSWRRDRVSAGLFVPYALWVGFASTLNLSIALLN